jgi:surfeit locus 1 family protein
VVLAFVVAGVCVKLGFWQLDRLHGRRDVNARIRVGLAQPARPLSELLAEHPATALGFRQTTVTGTYDTTDEVILYGRTLDGRNGNHVLTIVAGCRSRWTRRRWGRRRRRAAR